MFLQILFHLLYPFYWRLVYVPVLFHSRLELLEAPGTFIMGCHRRHTADVMQLDDVVIVDIDAGRVDVSRVEHKQPEMPPSCSKVFIEKCNSALKDYELFEIGR